MKTIFWMFTFALVMPTAHAASIGYYSDGRQQDASTISMQGEGYIKIFQHRHNSFGAPSMIAALEAVAKQLKSKYPAKDRIQIADLSSKQGGFLEGHGSHQNGLDVDIAFIRMDQTEQAPNYDQNATSGFKEVFVKGGKLTANFDVIRNWELIRLLVETKRVQRIFVDPAVKRKFCGYLQEKGLLQASRATLSRVKLEPDHTEHMHVRFYCPSESPQCKSQAEVAGDTGCDI